MATTTNKLFTFAGVSLLNGQYKVRFANDASRIKVLKANGHLDIRLAELDGPVTKLEAINEIKDMPGFDDANAQAAFADFFASQEPKQPKRAPKVEQLKAALAELQQETAEEQVVEQEQDTVQVDVVQLKEQAIAQAAEMEEQTA